VSDVQLNANELPDSTAIPPTSPGSNPTWENAAKNDHDPFDLFRIDLAAFRLVPLIISSGRDESFGIRMNVDYSIPVTNYWQGVNNPTASFNLGSAPILSPYVKVHDPADGANVYLGADDGTKTKTDDIHNHLIGTR
jgi:hypothetical protein